MKTLIIALIFLIPLLASDKTDYPVNFNTYISQVELPDRLYLCGEEVDLTDPELRERAERELYILLQQPGQIILYLKRSGRYFDMYDTYIERFDLPNDLKYVSVAESALYMSRSSKGAEGLWQIMDYTAKSLGLRVDDHVDERRHPEKSTVAAMQYLAEGYKKFNSWNLAIAAYNRGHFGIKDDVEFQMKDNYYDLYLNEETSRYYFRVLIIKEIMENLGKYGFLEDEIEKYNFPESKEIEVNTSIKDLSKWAQQYNTDYKTVKILNPWIKKRELNSPKGNSYYIKIPVE